MPTVVLESNDKVIKVTLQYPDEITVPSGLNQQRSYRGTLTVQNTSNLPIKASRIKLDLDNDIAGYDVECLQGGHPVNTLTLDFGALAAGASGTRGFSFHVLQVWAQVPPQQGRSLTFQVMPSYEIKHEPMDFGRSHQALVVKEGTPASGLGAGFGPSWDPSAVPNDPNIEVTQSFFSKLTVPTSGQAGHHAVHVKITNKAPVAITYIELSANTGDDLSAYDLLCSPDTHKWDTHFTTGDLGRIEPGDQLVRHYWERVAFQPNLNPAPEQAMGILAIAPLYKVEYERHSALKQKAAIKT